MGFFHTIFLSDGFRFVRALPLWKHPPGVWAIIKSRLCREAAKVGGGQGPPVNNAFAAGDGLQGGRCSYSWPPLRGGCRRSRLGERIACYVSPSGMAFGHATSLTEGGLMPRRCRGIRGDAPQGYLLRCVGIAPYERTTRVRRSNGGRGTPRALVPLRSTA